MNIYGLSACPALPCSDVLGYLDGAKAPSCGAGAAKPLVRAAGRHDALNAQLRVEVPQPRLFRPQPLVLAVLVTEQDV